ncbi:hypothetical protein GCM10010495_66170 [Kitasatospora herbaricolor]|uniref:hypothetical protein n=1 Tax=Kitasatospora herbaricolor TaxID=68217 RepID=UPI0019983571|nr:hypothetical protein [Kitasatospora herbaricolor]MDQ0307971.1 hypothetical protein [Kitasatospora herbaricolor]GGV39571.1 hypothetical protein GCM10010495_66170 [Kitasatospora herbaricolor]
MSTRIPPLAGADLWQAVMAAAAGRCQCRGTCGKSHAKDGGRCPREHSHLAHHLIAAPAEPADLLLAPHQAAALPKTALAAWCPPCHDATLSAARKTRRTAAPAAEPDSLF